MVCAFINNLATIFPKTEMLHNNIFGVIKEMQFGVVDVKNKK
jgi:hypothetical protein